MTIRSWTEFWCPYCQLWLTDAIHRPNHHNDPDEVDERRADRFRRVSSTFPASTDARAQVSPIENSRPNGSWHEDT